MASRSHGVVTRRELVAAGITRAEIEQRLADGSLIREYRGVYRVGHTAPSVEARYLAAVRACGDDAVLSGKPAAFLHELIRGTPPAPEVTTKTDRQVPGVKTRRSNHIERTNRKGIPITTVPRTLVDLAAELSDEALARACHEAGVRYRTTPAQVEMVLATRSTTKGASKLRRVLLGEARVTLSALERRFLQLVREAGLPIPVTNRPAGGPAGRLPLARAPADGRARQLPLPRLAPRLGAGPPARARGARTRRRLPPLHVRGRLRAPSRDARRAPLRNLARMVIAIDGPAGAGKSTVARAVAQTLGFTYLDSGAMYRAVALSLLRDSGSAAERATELQVPLGEDVLAAIRTPEISEAASKVATNPGVRAALVDKQRELMRQGDWVAEGRDIGTVVAPHAELKVFLTADPDERARRRATELGTDAQTVLRDQTLRDEQDRSREHSPLEPAADSVEVDTTGLSIEAVVERIAALARERQ